MWFEFVTFLRNTSITFCPTDILPIWHTHTHTTSHRPTNPNTFSCESSTQFAMTTTTTKYPIIKPQSCFSLLEQATDITAQYNKHHDIPLPESRYWRTKHITPRLPLSSVQPVTTTCAYTVYINTHPFKQHLNCEISVLGIQLNENQHPQARPLKISEVCNSLNSYSWTWYTKLLLINVVQPSAT
jgi:hypothetical protein